jgi:hypothetical protein
VIVGCCVPVLVTVPLLLVLLNQVEAEGLGTVELADSAQLHSAPLQPPVSPACLPAWLPGTQVT